VELTGEKATISIHETHAPICFAARVDFAAVKIGNRGLAQRNPNEDEVILKMF
jgi:hypothetical protein